MRGFFKNLVESPLGEQERGGTKKKNYSEHKSSNRTNILACSSLSWDSSRSPSDFLLSSASSLVLGNSNSGLVLKKGTPRRASSVVVAATMAVQARCTFRSYCDSSSRSVVGDCFFLVRVEGGKEGEGLTQSSFKGLTRPPTDALS